MTLSIAHVGTTQGDPENKSDQIQVVHWIIRNDPELRERWLEEPHKLDYIALDEGRDFLAESKNYDIVILHRLYADPSFMEDDTGYFAQSTLQTPQNWRVRLIKTRATHIFALGSAFEISGDYIGDIPSREKIKVRGMTVYRRKPSARKIAMEYIRKNEF